MLREGSCPDSNFRLLNRQYEDESAGDDGSQTENLPMGYKWGKDNAMRDLEECEMRDVSL
jgi:hypothetical protein